jgi:polyhydroxyalkanoate synthesis repressor PhaR
MRLIKRYKNRRLYDTELKKTITLADIKKYVGDDIDLKVIDNTTGRDITIPVLSQIVGESRADLRRSGAKVIGMIIKKGGINIMDVLKKLALASIGAANLTAEKLEEMFDELVKKGEISEDERSRAIKEFVEKTTESSEKARKWAEDTFKSMSTRLSSKFKEQITQLSIRIEQLNVRLNELERRMDGNVSPQ